MYPPKYPNPPEKKIYRTSIEFPSLLKEAKISINEIVVRSCKPLFAYFCG